MMASDEMLICEALKLSNNYFQDRNQIFRIEKWFISPPSIDVSSLIDSTIPL